MKNPRQNPRLISPRFQALIRAQRSTMGLSQVDAANLAGWKNGSTWRVYENGLRVPTIIVATRMLNVFGLGLEFK